MEFKKARDCFIFGSESIAMGNEEYATTFVVSEFWDRLQKYDCDDKGVSSLVKFCNRNRDNQDTAYMFSDFKISHIPRAQNGISVFLT